MWLHLVSAACNMHKHIYTAHIHVPKEQFCKEFFIHMENLDSRQFPCHTSKKIKIKSLCFLPCPIQKGNIPCKLLDTLGNIQNETSTKKSSSIWYFCHLMLNVSMSESPLQHLLKNSRGCLHSNVLM